MKKRILAVLLCLIFLFSILPGMALADDGASTTEPTSTTEADTTAAPTSTTEADTTAAPTSTTEADTTTAQASSADQALVAAPAPDPAPAYGVTTGDASNITAYGADISLTYSAPASEQGYEVSIFCGPEGSKDHYGTSYTSSGLAADNVSGSVTIDGLLPGTTYEYYARIRDNQSGTNVATGATKTFTTAPVDGTLTAASPATLAGANIKYVYKFVPESADSYLFALSGAGSVTICGADGSYWTSSAKDAAFSVAASGLTAGATYYVFVSGASSGEVLTVSGADSGKCGANLTWSLSSGVLTISGTGDMYNGMEPWLSVCSSITTIDLADGVTSIGDNAFTGTNLTSISIPSGVTSIGDSAFSGCTHLTSVTLSPSSALTSIGYGAFYGCDALEDISIPSSVTSIGERAFIYCPMPASLDLSHVTSIGEAAFVYCDGMTSVTLSGSIGSRAFQGCEGLTSVSLTSGVTSVAPDAFEDCTALQTISVDGADAAYTDVDGVLFTKDLSELVCYPAGRTADSYTVPSGVTSIGETAFERCASLSSVTLPSGLTDIGGRAFCGCSNLNVIMIPDSVTDIGPVAFNATGLKDVYYGGTEAQWDAVRVEMYNTPLTGATIHYASYFYQNVVTGDVASVTSGGAAVQLTYTSSARENGYQVGVRYGTSSGSYTHSVRDEETGSAENASKTLRLKNLIPNTTYYYVAVILDESTGRIIYGSEKTFKTSAAQELMIGSPVTLADADSCYMYSFTPSNDGNYRFALDAGGTVEIYNASTGGFVEVYEEQSAFSGIANLTAGTEYYVYVSADSADAVLTASVPDPASCGPHLTWIFDSTSGTLTISGAGNMDEFSYEYQPWFDDVNEIKSVVLESGVTSVGRFAFTQCTNLTDVALPSGLTDIGYAAFADCVNLKDVTFPAGLTSIGGNAFLRCVSLTDITLPSGLTSIGSDAFGDCTALASIALPSSLTSIENAAFFGCTHLANIALPSGLTNIGNSAFSCCSALASIALPSGITCIQDNTFRECTGLTNIAIPGSVKSVGNRAFLGCSVLTNVYYGGTENDWSAVQIGESNDPLTGAAIHYNAYHTLTYSANGGAGSMTDAVSPYYPGATATVLPNGFTKDNYTFDHWNTEADGTGTSYNAGDTFAVTADTTLYAIWTENAKYTVSYNCNNGTGTMTDSNSPYYIGTAATILENTFTAPSGWMFKEWNTKPDGTGTSYNAGDTFAVTADTTLYAIWKEVPVVTVTAGGSQTHTLDSTGTLTLTCNGALSDLTTITINGVTILDHTDGTTSNGICIVVSGSTILTLKNSYLESLQPGTYTVTFNYASGASASTTFMVKGSPAQTGETGTPQTGSKTGTPQTGDETRIGLWLGLMLGSCALLTGTGVFLSAQHRRGAGRKKGKETPTGE